MKVTYKVGDYYDGSDKRPEGSFRISPSSVEDFFSKKRQWYGENLLGEDKKFTGSTATLNGTLVHFVAETVANCKIHKEEYNSEKLHNAVAEYISKFEGNEDYDTSMVQSTWKDMGEALVKAFVLEANTLATEVYEQYEIQPGIFVAGTMDAIVSSSPTDTIDNIKDPTGVLTLVDFKTSSTKASSFSYKYTLQAMCYCYMLRQKGINITNMELQFVTKATKTLPIRTYKFTKPFDDQAHTFIEGILKLIAESVECFKNYEDLQFLLACDYRLKKNDIPRPS